MGTSPRVLHLNDCAFVGEHLVAAARRSGRPWRILRPEQTWAPVRPGRTTTTRLDEARTLARIARATARAQVVHVHFATTVRRLRPIAVPRRPYVLHLHGTDIRTLWADPNRHAQIQAYIDGAAHVFYSTRDNEHNATTARADAEYLPIFIEPTQLPSWTPGEHVVFASRWEEVKGLEDMLRVARDLVSAGVDVRGLDWGPGASLAAEVGVKLLPKMPHDEFLRFLSSAGVVIGQATSILSVSEVEAMGIGVPLAAVGSHLPGPDGASLPIREGEVEEVVGAVLSDLQDPLVASNSLGGKDWALRWHTADQYVPRLEETYRKILT